MTNTFTIRQITGALVIIGSGSFRHRGTVLSMSFEWPDILRQDPDLILTKFRGRWGLAGVHLVRGCLDVLPAYLPGRAPRSGAGSGRCVIWHKAR